MARLPVLKTYKILIDGRFPRSESGRHFQLTGKNNVAIANICLCSKKDLKAAQMAARKALPQWQTKSSYNRGQILYRAAEMLEGRIPQFVEELKMQGLTTAAARSDAEQAVDRLIYYAGWCDKYSQLFSSVNPVQGPYFNYALPEPTGVVGVLLASESLLGLVSVIAPIIAGGNTCILLASSKFPLSAVTFGEVLVTSDLPAGVVNILTGEETELAPQLSLHRDINALVYTGKNAGFLKQLQQNCANNVKRLVHWDCEWKTAASAHPYQIMDLQETKANWMTMEMPGMGGGAY